MCPGLASGRFGLCKGGHNEEIKVKRCQGHFNPHNLALKAPNAAEHFPHNCSIPSQIPRKVPQRAKSAIKPPDTNHFSFRKCHSSIDL